MVAGAGADLVREDFERAEDQDVILPLTVLRRLDAQLVANPLD